MTDETSTVRSAVPTVVTDHGGSRVNQTTFKTLYFPKERVRGGAPARVTVSLPVSQTEHFPFGMDFIRSASSTEIRSLLGDPFLEDVEAAARDSARSFSNFILWSLERTAPVAKSASSVERPSKRLGVTFQESRHQPVHSWYPYAEGFSATYARDALLRFGRRPRLVFDPFGGAGTVQVAASWLGVDSAYCEINPLMAFVAETKVNSARVARGHLGELTAGSDEFLRALGDARRFAGIASEVDLAAYHAAFPNRGFFEEPHLRGLLSALRLADEIARDSGWLRDLLRLAVAANIVHSSNMTRRADLRRRRADEYRTRVVDVRTMVAGSVRRMVREVAQVPVDAGGTTLVSPDCRHLPDSYVGAFDLAVTSPPYLNGTNYFRNTKLEMWMLGFLESERSLPSFASRGITSGINNVSKARGISHSWDTVEEVAGTLDRVAPDKRIPLMVRQYFSDMYQMFVAVSSALVPDGRFILDMGDSKFYGVHVPTDRLLIEVAATAGFRLDASNFLARRVSRDKTPLVQVELVFAK